MNRSCCIISRFELVFRAKLSISHELMLQNIDIREKKTYTRKECVYYQSEVAKYIYLVCCPATSVFTPKSFFGLLIQFIYTSVHVQSSTYTSKEESFCVEKPLTT